MASIGRHQVESSMETDTQLPNVSADLIRELPKGLKLLFRPLSRPFHNTLPPPLLTSPTG
jgi:hypothetical protein